MSEQEAMLAWAEAVAAGEYTKAVEVLEKQRDKPDSLASSFPRYMKTLLVLSQGWSAGCGLDDESQRREARRCSFCGFGEAAGRKLIAGPDIFICEACVKQCANVLGLL